MASKKVQIQIDTKANTAGAQQAQQSLQSLDKTANQTNAAINTTTTNTSKLGGVMGNAGYQIQDFAVQVGAGTSALTAFSQQAPQLLGSFGPQGAVAGALVAVGAIAAKVFMDMAENAAMTGEAMEDMSDKLKEAFSASAAKAIDDFNFQLKNSTEFAQTLRDAELQLKEARDQRAASDARLIDSQLKLDEAAIKYLESTGQIVNAEEQLLAVRQKAAEQTKNAQIAEANAQIKQARNRYNNIVSQRQDVEAEVDAARKRMAKLEAEQQQLLSDQAFFSKQDKTLIKGGVQKEGYQSIRTQTATGQLASIENQIKDLYDKINEAPKRLEAITNEAMAQAGAVDSAIETASIQIDEINKKYNLTQRAQELTTATDQIKTGAEEIGATIAGFTPLNEQQAQAKATIQKALEDGKVTAQESQQIGASLQMLMSTLQSGQSVNLSTLQDLVKLNGDMMLKMQQLNKETSALRRQMGALQGTR